MSSSSSESDIDDRFNPPPRKVRKFRPRINFETDNSSVFSEKFRFTPEAIDEILEKIGDYLKPASQRNYALSPKENLLLAMRFFATGGFYHLVADAHGPSKFTVGRSIRRVVKAVNFVILPQEVKWPVGEQLKQLPRQFHAIAGMPCVAGCVDGTLINIIAPSEHEEQYVDRHGNHSLNCMMVAGPDYRFYYVNANWPGSVNDCRVLRTSALQAKLENGWRAFPNAILLGDSIYPTKEWLMPPISKPYLSVPEESFNRAHRSTRRMVESSYGILKQRFGCLQLLRFKDPKFACEVIKCCVALHNLCLRYSAPIVPDQNPVQLIQMGLEDTDSESEAEYAEPDDRAASSAALQRMARLVQYFVQN